MDKRTKLTDKQKQMIIADYVDTNNYSLVAKKYGVSVNGVKNIVLADKDIANKCRAKKEENTKSVLEYMESQNETKKQILDKLLRGIETKASELDMFTNIKDLATAYGIILDKEMKILELTKNKDDNVNAKITIVNSLPKDDSDGSND